MPIQILSTKLYAPRPTANLVERDTLVDRLDKGLSKPITIIAAPPGFGKTTVLSAWLSKKHDGKTAWYSLDEDDSEPGRFFAYIAASLRPLEADSVPTLDASLEAGSTNPRELALALLNDLSEFASENVILVLDDYHHITFQPIHDAVAYLIDHLPPNIHLVLISRADPPLPLGRWRVRGQLTEIRADDLRFTPGEAAQFLNHTMGLHLTAEDIQALEARTEGWVAGLQLAALSLQRSTNPSEMIASFAGSHRYIADYLTDEVLSRQNEKVRGFLLNTSILERFNADLCDHLLRLPAGASETILDELQRANLFIVPLDAETQWFRYHHLFAELLQRRLKQSGQVQALALHRQAAEWFEQKGFLLDAIRQWIAANRPGRVAELVEEAISTTWGQPDVATLMKRVESLPEAVIAEHPSLCAFLSWTWIWLGYGTERILPMLGRAEANLPKQRESLPAIGRFQVIRSVMSRIAQNDAPTAIRLADQALEQLAPDDHLWRGFAKFNIAIATHTSGQSAQEAEDAYSETVRLCRSQGDQTTSWIAACARVQLVMERGELQRATALNRELLDSLREKTGTSLVRGWAHINQAYLMYQVNNLPVARREADITQAVETQTGGMPDVSLRLYIMLAKLALLDKDEITARRVVDDLVALAQRGGVKNAIDWADAHRAQLMFRLEDWSAFDEWARSFELPEQPLFFPYRLRLILYARHLIRQKAWEEGRRLLEKQARLAREAGYVEYEMELDIVRAILELKAGRSYEAVQAITRALRIGAPHGYVRIFLDEGEAMKNILSQAQRTMKDDALQNYCADLLSAYGNPVPRKQSTLIEPLTEREIDVLKLIAEGCSSPEIAKRLFLSVGTVKTHIKHIYGKLGVGDRVKAASMARELGIS